MRGELHISAISIHAYAYVSERYALLPCGASMGDGYGPIVIRNDQRPTRTRSTFNEDQNVREWLGKSVIAIPGTYDERVPCVANLSRRIRARRCCRSIKFSMRSRDGRADAGLIIHEGQLTYEHAGFEKNHRSRRMVEAREKSLPLPLGGNVLRKDIPRDVQHDLLAIMRESIDYGLMHREEAVQHSMPYARDMDSALASKFIGMYVNEYTRDYGESWSRRYSRISRAAGRRGRISAKEYFRIGFRRVNSSRIGLLFAAGFIGRADELRSPAAARSSASPP